MKRTKWKGVKRMLAPDSVGSAVFSAVLAALCAALWLYQALRHGGTHAGELICGMAWLAAAVVWSLRAYRAHKNKEDKS